VPGALFDVGDVVECLGENHGNRVISRGGGRRGKAENKTGRPITGGLKADWLPGFLRNSEGAQGIRRPQLSVLPSNVRFTSGLNKSESVLLAFPVVVERPQDAYLIPTVNLTHLWRNTASLNWQPLGMLQLAGDLAITRDLREYSDSTPLGRLANQSRRTLAGLDVGVERDRQLRLTIMR
jgi:hypothetical protein